MTDEETRHDERCPQCKRFVEAKADGYYDREEKHDTGCAVRYDAITGDVLVECDCAAGNSYVTVFCDEACADRFHGRERWAAQ